VFDDSNKRMSLVVPSGSDKKTITINDASGALELKDDKGNTIKMDGSGILIDASKNNVTIKGAKVLIN
jgi:hypothetical protein